MHAEVATNGARGAVKASQDAKVTAEEIAKYLPGVKSEAEAADKERQTVSGHFSLTRFFISPEGGVPDESEPHGSNGGAYNLKTKIGHSSASLKSGVIQFRVTAAEYSILFSHLFAHLLLLLLRRRT